MAKTNLRNEQRKETGEKKLHGINQNAGLQNLVRLGHQKIMKSLIIVDILDGFLFFGASTRSAVSANSRQERGRNESLRTRMAIYTRTVI